jgi:hypothetical protein
MNGRNGEEFSVIYLARRGATAWRRAGRPRDPLIYRNPNKGSETPEDSGSG